MNLQRAQYSRKSDYLLLRHVSLLTLLSCMYVYLPTSHPAVMHVCLFTYLSPCWHACMSIYLLLTMLPCLSTYCISHHAALSNHLLYFSPCYLVYPPTVLLTMLPCLSTLQSLVYTLQCVCTVYCTLQEVFLKIVSGVFFNLAFSIFKKNVICHYKDYLFCF